jgi:aryl-alcohol dehydrogenase-like predicted oxidoreductase
MKIAIGTAQFGLDYGVSNTQGQSSSKQALEILEYACHNGISFLDTAPSYGNSEEVLGNIKSSQNYEIITKTPSFNSKIITNYNVKKLRILYRQSLIKLKRDKVYGLLVHNCNDLFKPGGEKLINEMRNIKLSGKIEKIGVSVYNGDQVNRLLNEYDIDLIQVPINILDQRLIKSNMLEKIKNHGIEIHARSVFLQGLLLMPLESTPAYFYPIKKQLEGFTIKSKELSVSKLELALGFVKSIDTIDKIIIGVSSLRQLSEVINSRRIQADFFDFNNLSVGDERFIDPSQWGSM